jgi:Outer membrane lipoprotein-sorting protein
LLVCLSSFAGFASSAQAQSRQYRPAPEYVQIGKPDQNEGKKIIEDFRQRGFYVGDYYFEFELRVMPRTGAERRVPARMWGSRNEKGPISRVVVAPGVVGQEARLLVQNGPEARVWKWDANSADSADTALSPVALFEPLAETDLTAFDLQMAFLFWNDYVFEGVSKMRGRPAHTFLMYPPKEVAEQKPDLSGIRVYLDTQYHALVQAEYIGPGGKPVKSISVLDLKKIDETWIVKSIDVRDERTRNKTRFTVTAAAVGLDFGGGLFTPDMLKNRIQPPPADKLRVVSP